MKTSQLRAQSVEELATLAKERRKELFDLRFKHYTGQLADTSQLKKVRREIARIETVIGQIRRAQAVAE